MTRPPYLLADGKTINPEWIARYRFAAVSKCGKFKINYIPSPKGLDFHENETLNCIMEGRRGTGKSWIMRHDAHMRALVHPGFVYLIVRKTMGELQKTHLKFLKREMLALDGTFNQTKSIAEYENGSLGFYASCNSEEEMLKLLGGDYHAIYFDEITTFSGEQIGKIGTCLRVPEDPTGQGVTILPRLRGGTNPIGPGADWVHAHFIAKDVPPDVEPDYTPDDYVAINLVAADNIYIDPEKYDKQFSHVPEHIRRAWKHGEWIIEGAYFNDFRPVLDDKPWHVITQLPQIEVNGQMRPFSECLSWLLVYRAVDWGFSPDPAVCLWIATLPNGRGIAFKEQDWLMTPASQVARQIDAASNGMRVVESMADPTLFGNQQASDFNSLADIFAENGVSLTKSRNDRAAIGFAIHEQLNTILEDGLPKFQIYCPVGAVRNGPWGCPQLAKTLPTMRTHDVHKERIADSTNDHWTITLGYHCQGRIGASSAPGIETTIPWWMRDQKSDRFTLGRESVRRHSLR